MPHIVIDNPQWGDWGGPERVEFDFDNPSRISETRQFYRRINRWITYNVSGIPTPVGADTIELTIIYDEHQNPLLGNDLGTDVLNPEFWGTHILVITRGQTNGPSTWNGNGGPGWSLEQIAGGPKNRRRSTIWAIQRNEQSDFRKQLLAMDGRCALTGEMCTEALEAAHIVPAHKGGQEVLSNGFLLRADIHRLYDASPQKFEICPETGKVSTNDFQYDSFDLRDCRIDDELLRRIRKALKKRKGIRLKSRCGGIE